MSKKIKILTPRIYEHSDFFHNAVDFAREHSLNTNELCLELSHYLVDNFDKVLKIEKPRVYKRIADLEAKLAESESEIKTLICDYESRITKNHELMSWLEHKNEELKQQLAKKDAEIENLNKEWVQSIHDWKEIVKKKDEEIALLEEHDMIFHNQLAIEQLEKVKELVHNRIKEIVNDLSEEDDERLNQKHTIHGLATAITDIDNQIEELKKEMK